MCISLAFAMEGGLISLEELRLAGREVRSYIEHLGCNKGCSLRKALWDNSLPNDFLARKAIYLDWNNRPKPWKERGV